MVRTSLLELFEVFLVLSDCAFQETETGRACWKSSKSLSSCFCFFKRADRQDEKVFELFQQDCANQNTQAHNPWKLELHSCLGTILPQPQGDTGNIGGGIIVLPCVCDLEVRASNMNGYLVKATLLDCPVRTMYHHLEEYAACS